MPVVAAAGFIVVLAMTLAFGLRDARMLELVRTGYYPSAETSSQLSFLLKEIQRGLQDAVTADDAASLVDVDRSYARFNRKLDEAAASPVADVQRLAALRSAMEQYYTLSRRTSQQIIIQKSLATLGPDLTAMKLCQNAVDALLQDSIGRDHRAISAAFARSLRIQRTTMTVMTAVVLTCVIALLAGSFLNHRLLETRQRNESLLRHRAELEEQVEARTGELRATTRELVVARDHNRLILDSAGEGIFGLDHTGTATFINPAAARMLGWSVEELAGRYLHDLIHSDTDANIAEEACAVCSRTLQPAVRFGNSVRFCNRTGGSIPVEYTCSAIKGDDGTPTGVVVTFRDITERLAVEQMKNEFVSTVSHELRTPLTSIRGALGLMSSGLIGKFDDRAQRMLDIAVGNTDRLIRLINDVLDLERIDSGKIELTRGRVSVAELMKQAAEGLQTLAEKAGVTVAAEPADAVLWIDSDRIIQTLTNLLSNAIKFSPVGTTITLSGISSPADFTFRVADQGRGIPAHRLESIFERFQQVDASDSRDKGGSGLGLAICRSIVNAHGGRIWAESIPGQGSVFQFTTPWPPARASFDAGEKRTLLVCEEDEPHIGELLEGHGFQVFGAARAADVPSRAAETHPHAIILDLGSNDGNGWQVVEALKANEATREIPIVIATVQPPESYESHAAAIASWIHKPFLQEELLDALRVARGAPAILIVEDDLDLARVLIALLQQHGVNALHAATGREAVQICQHQTPSLIVLDLILPDMDGYAIVAALRQETNLGEVPLLVYSALEVKAADQARLTLGPTEFMTKSRGSLSDFESQVVRLLNGVTTPERRRVA